MKYSCLFGHVETSLYFKVNMCLVSNKKLYVEQINAIQGELLDAMFYFILYKLSVLRKMSSEKRSRFKAVSYTYFESVPHIDCIDARPCCCLLYSVLF